MAPQKLDFILTNAKSPLTTIDILRVLNPSTWALLSPDARAKLSALLPSTAFPDYRLTLDPSHPIASASNHPLPPSTSASTPEPDPAFFSDPHFEAAAHTFQDHLFSGWLTPAHKALIFTHHDRVRAGTHHAPWKDDAWLLDHPPAIPSLPGPSRSGIGSTALAGGAAGLRLTDLAQHAVLHPGDLLAYKRTFRFPNDAPLTVEKDTLIHAIHPTTYALTILVGPGPVRALPHAIRHHELSFDAEDADVREMTITSPAQLEAALLDLDARVPRARRPNGNAWKHTTLWRVPAVRDGAIDADGGALGDADTERGGRECHGTLFYLRGCFYHEQ